MQNKCLIYCRVSSQRQVEEGHGLESQEQRCRNYALNNEYKVESVFLDEGISGGLFERPAMKELIKYLNDHPTESYYIVFDDISRFARDIKTHLLLKAELISRGATLKCLNFNFEDTPEGEFAENISACAAQYDRQKNRRQVIQKMKARLEQGYWPFRSPPRGLSYVKDPLRGKVLRLIQPYARIFKDAIESYDKGLLNTLEEVRLFIWRKYQEAGIKKEPSLSGTQSILTELLYTGYLEYEKWGIKRMKGQHESFIDIETYNRVQAKLAGKSKMAARKDYNLDFPLRGFILCDSCQKPLTAAWVHGRSAKYPKYWCKNKNCEVGFVSIPREIMERQFETLLQSVKPSAEVIELTKDVLNSAWSMQEEGYLSHAETSRKRIVEIGEKINNLTDLIASKLSSGDNEIIKIYEEQIRKLSKERESLQADLNKPSYTPEQLRTATNEVLQVLKEPVVMWKSEVYKDKLTLLNMYFQEKLQYQPKVGYRTATLALPIALLKQNEAEKIALVEMPGFEPGSEKTLL